jgi:hypothetical protein
MLEKPGFLFLLILILSIIHYTYGGSIEDKYFCKRNHQKGNRARIIGGHQARAGKTLFLKLCQIKKHLTSVGIHHIFNPFFGFNQLPDANKGFKNNAY